jgi:two-component system chemotaxis response regulator CheY
MIMNLQPKTKVIKVLLVDDSSTIIRGLEQVLKKIFLNPLEILVANDGKAALEQLACNRDIEFIFLDINMPVMCGDEFLKITRFNPIYNDIKIIMVTTESERKVVMQCMKIGSNGFIVKPFSFESIVKSLRPITERMGYEINDKDEVDFI